MATSRAANREAICALTDEFPLVVAHFGVTPEVDLPLHDEAMMVAEEVIDESRMVRLLRPEQVAAIEILKERKWLPVSLDLDTLAIPGPAKPIRKASTTSDGPRGLRAAAEKAGEELRNAALAAEAKYSFLDAPTTIFELNAAVQRSASRNGSAAATTAPSRQNTAAETGKTAQITEEAVASTGLRARMRQRRAARRQRKIDELEQHWHDFMASAFA